MLKNEDIRCFRKIREKHKNNKIVFASGTFDLPHAGHILFLEDCKNLGDILVVGVGSDAITRARKGKERPLVNERVRLKTILSFKPVDYCFLDNSSSNEKPLNFLKEVFEHLEPDVYVINDDAFDIPYREKLTKKYGVELVILKRTCPPEFENISTSGLIEKIKGLNQK